MHRWILGCVCRRSFATMHFAGYSRCLPGIRRLMPFEKWWKTIIFHKLGIRFGPLPISIYRTEYVYDSEIFSYTLYWVVFLQGYFVISIALLILLLLFYMTFFFMANNLNRNNRLRKENQLLIMQQQRYDNLQTAIEEVKAGTDMICDITLIDFLVLADEGDNEKIKEYLSDTVARIPSLEMHFCTNRAADSVIGYYCAIAKRENIPYSVRVDLPERNFL